MFFSHVLYLIFAALVGSLSLASMGLFSPVSARLIDRYGCRVMMICGGLTCAVALFASSFSPNIYVLFVVYGLGFGFGASFIYISAFQIIPLYFERHRSFATAISSIGPGVGLLLMSPIIQTLLENFDWRKALMILAAANLAPCILGNSIKRKSKPSLQSKQDSTKKEKPIGCCKCSSLTYNSALFKNQVFVLLCTSMTISCLALAIPAVHLVSEGIVGVESKKYFNGRFYV
jgi:MFS family permease